MANAVETATPEIGSMTEGAMGNMAEGTTGSMTGSAAGGTMRSVTGSAAAGISFRSIGHFFATFFDKAEGILAKLQGTAGTVEAVTATVPVYGPLALSVEKTAYAVLAMWPQW